MGEKIYNLLRMIGLVLFIAGLMLIGFGVTGNVFLDPSSIPDHCTLDSDCHNGKICCVTDRLTQKSSSLCLEPQVCNGINDNGYLAGAFQFKKYLSPYFTFGIALLVISVILFVVSSITNGDIKSPQKTKRKAKKKLHRA
jgi:hypothetical protein